MSAEYPCIAEKFYLTPPCPQKTFTIRNGTKYDCEMIGSNQEGALICLASSSADHSNYLYPGWEEACLVPHQEKLANLTNPDARRIRVTNILNSLRTATLYQAINNYRQSLINFNGRIPDSLRRVHHHLNFDPVFRFAEFNLLNRVWRRDKNNLAFGEVLEETEVVKARLVELYGEGVLTTPNFQCTPSEPALIPANVSETPELEDLDPTKQALLDTELKKLEVASQRHLPKIFRPVPRLRVSIDHRFLASVTADGRVLAKIGRNLQFYPYDLLHLAHILDDPSLRSAVNLAFFDNRLNGEQSAIERFVNNPLNYRGQPCNVSELFEMMRIFFNDPLDVILFRGPHDPARAIFDPLERVGLKNQRTFLNIIHQARFEDLRYSDDIESRHVPREALAVGYGGFR